MRGRTVALLVLILGCVIPSSAFASDEAHAICAAEGARAALPVLGAAHHTATNPAPLQQTGPVSPQMLGSQLGYGQSGPQYAGQPLSFANQTSWIGIQQTQVGNQFSGVSAAALGVGGLTGLAAETRISYTAMCEGQAVAREAIGAEEFRQWCRTHPLDAWQLSCPAPTTSR